METISLPSQSLSKQAFTANTVHIPQYLYACVLASTSIITGLIWDISWHMSIGRDGLFSAPHLAIYLGGIVAGIFSGFRILKITLVGTPAERNESIRFWGVFYGSLGALFCVWGALAMLTSAPFDDWWHNTYGLDVTILSPPHTVLALGMITIQFGAMVSVLAQQNRYAHQLKDDAATRKRMNLLFAISAGFMIAMAYTIASEYFSRHDMHGVLFYQVASGLFLLLLIPVSVASQSRWGATSAAAVYTLFMAAMVWILPLFPAEPKLGPVLNHITHFQAFHFPILLLVPAVVIDLINQKFATRNKWFQSLLYAPGFLFPLLIVQWPFGDFLMSPLSRNWFFGTTSWYFGSNPDYQYRFAYGPWMVSSGIDLIKGLLIALAIGFLSSRIALSWGNWMKRVAR